MILFLFVGLVLLLGALLPVKRQIFFAPVPFFLLFVISAFRDYSVGTDTYNYEVFFNNVSSGVDWVRFALEPGWVFLNDMVAFFEADFRSFLILTSLLTLALVFISAFYGSPNPLLSVSFYYLFYFFFYSLNISRQMLAVSIVALSLVFLMRDRKLIFLVLVLLASSFHFSALVTLPLVFFDRLPGDRAIFAGILILSAVIGLFGINYVSSVVSLTAYGGYVESYQAGTLLGNALYLLFFLCVFFFIMIFFRAASREFKLFFIFAVILCLTIRLPFGSRIAMFFSVYQIFFYPYFLSMLRNNRLEVKLLAVFLVLSFAILTFVSRFGAGGILPYKNVFF